MKTIEVNFLNSRKLQTHIFIFLTSALLAVLYLLIFGDIKPKSQVIDIFILIFFQFEIFILIANLIFGNVTESRNRKKFTRQVLLRFAFFYLTCFISSMAIFVIYLYAKYWIMSWDTSTVLFNFIHVEFRGWFKSTFIGLSIGAVIFLITLWQDALKKEQKLKEENLIFQNETLKNQVNPHFLFNSLNTLSSLVSTQTEVAEQFIQRLSSIYRYILESSTKNKVPLKSELDFINDYFFLHKIRDDDKIQLKIDVQNVESFEILPVSLQSLIENAVKHNMSTHESPLVIQIYTENLYIVVKNNLQEKASKLQSTQTGLKNLGERIRLVTGKELVIEQTAVEYTVKIPLIK